MDIYKIYENCIYGDFPYTDVYCVHGRFVSLDSYLLSYNFYNEEDYDGLLSYLAFNQHVAYLSKNFVLAEKYKNQIDIVLNKMKSAESDINIYNGTSVPVLKVKEVSKNEQKVTSSDIEIEKCEFLLSVKELKSSLLFLSTVPDRCDLFIDIRNEILAKSEIVVSVQENILANILPIISLFKLSLCKKLTHGQINIANINLLDKLSIKQISVLVTILSKAILDVQKMEQILSEYEDEIYNIQDTLYSKAHLSSTQNMNMFKVSDKNSLNFTSFDIKDTIRKSIEFILNSGDKEVLSNMEIVSNTEKHVVKEYVENSVFFYLKYTTLNKRTVVPLFLYKELDNIVRYGDTYFTRKFAGHRESLQANYIDKVMLLDFTIGTMFDVNGAPESLEYKNLTTKKLDGMTLYSNLEGHMSSYFVFNFMQGVCEDMKELLRNFELIEQFPSVAKDISSFIFCTDVMSYIQDVSNLQNLNEHDLYNMINLVDEYSLELFKEYNLTDLGTSVKIEDKSNLITTMQSLQSLSEDLKKLISGYVEELDAGVADVTEFSDLSVASKSRIEAVVSTFLRKSDFKEIDGTVDWKTLKSYIQEIDSRIVSNKKDISVEEIESIVSQYLAHSFSERSSAIKFKEMLSYTKDLKDKCINMNGIIMFDTKFKQLDFSTDTYKLDKLPKFAMYEILLSFGKIKKVEKPKQKLIDKSYSKQIYLNIDIKTDKMEKDTKLSEIEFTIKVGSKDVYSTVMDLRDIIKVDKEGDNYTEKVPSDRTKEDTVKIDKAIDMSSKEIEKQGYIHLESLPIDKAFEDSFLSLVERLSKDNKNAINQEDREFVEKYIKELYKNDNIALICKGEKFNLISNEVSTFIKEKLFAKLDGISKDGIEKTEKYLEDLIENVLLDLYGRWYFLPDEGPYDEMIVPSEDHDYEKVPVKGRTEHPFPQGSELATEEIAVPINIISNVIDFFKEVLNSYGAFYRNVVPQQALTHFVTTVYDWVTIYIPQNIDKIPQYYPDDYEVIENSKEALEDYQRIYRWVRWYAEGITNNIPEEDKKLLVGYKYVTMLVTELENYYNLHHGVYISNFLAKNDKEKGVRHKILHSLKSLVHKEGVGMSHKYLPKNEEYVRKRWMEGGRK